MLSVAAGETCLPLSHETALPRSSHVLSALQGRVELLKTHVSVLINDGHLFDCELFQRRVLLDVVDVALEEVNDGFDVQIGSLSGHLRLRRERLRNLNLMLLFGALLLLRLLVLLLRLWGIELDVLCSQTGEVVGVKSHSGLLFDRRRSSNLFLVARTIIHRALATRATVGVAGPAWSVLLVGALGPPDEHVVLGHVVVGSVVVHHVHHQQLLLHLGVSIHHLHLLLLHHLLVVAESCLLSHAGLGNLFFISPLQVVQELLLLTLNYASFGHRKDLLGEEGFQSADISLRVDKDLHAGLFCGEVDPHESLESFPTHQLLLNCLSLVLLNLRNFG